MCSQCVVISGFGSHDAPVDRNHEDDSPLIGRQLSKSMHEKGNGKKRRVSKNTINKWKSNVDTRKTKQTEFSWRLDGILNEPLMFLLPARCFCHVNINAARRLVWHAELLHMPDYFREVTSERAAVVFLFVPAVWLYSCPGLKTPGRRKPGRNNNNNNNNSSMIL